MLVPMQLKSGSFLLVDRGWIPYSLRQDAKAPALHGRQTVTGVLRLPHHHWMQPVNHPEKGEWYGYDLGAMAEAAGVSALPPFVLEADATPHAGGYPLGGQTRVDLPNNHFGYALTWYGLAAVLLVIYGVSGWQKKRKP
jgi:surfeit locus 1 family protein